MHQLDQTKRASSTKRNGDFLKFNKSAVESNLKIDYNTDINKNL